MVTDIHPFVISTYAVECSEGVCHPRLGRKMPLLGPKRRLRRECILITCPDGQQTKLCPEPVEGGLVERLQTCFERNCVSTDYVDSVSTRYKLPSLWGGLRGG